MFRNHILVRMLNELMDRKRDDTATMYISTEDLITAKMFLDMFRKAMVAREVWLLLMSRFPPSSLLVAKQPIIEPPTAPTTKTPFSRCICSSVDACHSCPSF
mmetsp:Transcript_40303/g.59796  ORF Transcript_40303/g.59796 Transcript_40303/m.59796 type:complete len:102 (-) Transcript_40303:25-330(-)